MKKLLEKLAQTWRHTEADKIFIAKMRQALSDGILTEEERFWLLECHSKLGAGDAWREVAPELFLAAVKGAINIHDEILPGSAMKLREIQEYLELTQEQAKAGLDLLNQKIKNGISRAAKEAEDTRRWEFREQALRDLQSGNSPTVYVPNLVYQPGEAVIWTCPATQHEAFIADEGTYQGASVRIASGLYYNFGVSGGQDPSNIVLKPVDSGMFLVSTRRLIFQGERYFWTDDVADLQHFETHTDSLIYSTAGSAEKRFIKFHIPQGDFCSAAIDRVLQDLDIEREQE